MKRPIRILMLASLVFATGSMIVAEDVTAIPEAAQAEMKAAQELMMKAWTQNLDANGQPTDSFPGARKVALRGALDHYRRAAKMAPRNLEVHRTLIGTQLTLNDLTLKPEEARKAYRALTTEYERKAAKEPKNAIWQILLGDIMSDMDPLGSRHAYERAVQLDPNQAEALQMLGVFAETRGENVLAREYSLKAAQARPSDHAFLGGYAWTLFNTGDVEGFRTELKGNIERYPDSPEVINWLYWLGTKAPAEERREYLQQAIDRYPVEDVSEDKLFLLWWIYKAMFESLQQDDSLAAEDFARQAVSRFAGKQQQKDWFTSYRRQSDLNVARAAREAMEPAAALEILARLKTDASESMKSTIAYEEALNLAANGQSTKAMQTLIDSLRAEANPVAEAAFYDIAAKAGKSDQEAEELLWSARKKDARPFKDFQLKDVDGKTVSIAEYRGHVVLVNFWYPLCGPCRSEFPYLQKIVEQFRDQPFVVLALNVHPQEAENVRPFMEGNKYDFRALQTPTDSWAEQNYSVSGTPFNVLLDQQGRVVAEPKVHDDDTAARLSIQIRQLLDRGSASQTTPTSGQSRP